MKSLFFTVNNLSDFGAKVAIFQWKRLILVGSFGNDSNLKDKIK